MSFTSLKSFGEALQPWAVILATVVIPAVIWWSNVRAERERINLQYVRVALAILQEESATVSDQSPEAGEARRELRDWAVEILNRTAPVPLKGQVRAYVLDGTIVFPDQIWYESPKTETPAGKPRAQRLPYDPDSSQSPGG